VLKFKEMLRQQRVNSKFWMQDIHLHFLPHVQKGSLLRDHITYIQSAAFNVTHLELAILLVWVVGGVADNGVGFRVALDSVNNETLVHAATRILCGTVHVNPCSESFVGNLVMIGIVGLHVQEM
jgi:hypothetical protein